MRVWHDARWHDRSDDGHKLGPFLVVTFSKKPRFLETSRYPTSLRPDNHRFQTQSDFAKWFSLNSLCSDPRRTQANCARNLRVGCREAPFRRTKLNMILGSQTGARAGPKTIEVIRGSIKLVMNREKSERIYDNVNIGPDSQIFTCFFEGFINGFRTIYFKFGWPPFCTGTVVHGIMSSRYV